MFAISKTQRLSIHSYVFQHARLLERQLFDYFFGSGSQEACLRALQAFQNPDGGFGNGLEPDLLCPGSSAIGAESALFVLDILDSRDPSILEPLVDWLVTQQQSDGILPHPPADMQQYPYQEWWGNPDHDRVLAISAYLVKFESAPPEFLKKADAFYRQTTLPAPDNYYNYPYFLYQKYVSARNDSTILPVLSKAIPLILEKHADHFPLFNRAWYHATDLLSPDVVHQQAQIFVDALQPDGGLLAPYPQCPWWRPIWTVEGLILLKRAGLLID